MRGVREYPKIIAERVQSPVRGYGHEYLRLTANDDGTASLAVCRYEALASVEEFIDEKGDLNLPDKVAGKAVISVDDEWIVGGELTCCGTGCTYGQSEISSAIDWVRLKRWVPTSWMMTQLFRAAFVAQNQKEATATSQRYRRPRSAHLAASGGHEVRGDQGRIGSGRWCPR
jgi:hypothetical protein